jgi:hypothetical protein
MARNKENIKQISPFKIFNFNAISPQPVNKIMAKDSFVAWGEKNEYPQYLLDLYSTASPVHKAIISRKIKMIAGEGFGLENDPLDLDTLALRLDTDYEIFNGFCFEIIYANDGSVLEMNHVPYKSARKGIKNDEIDFDYYWISTDWSQYKKQEHKPQFIRAYNPLIKTGRQLFYYVEYSPEAEYYPTPYYSTVLNWVELDERISTFHLNQVKRGYSPQFILNFGTGIPSDEEMDDYVRQFKKEYQGETGENIIITFSEGGDQKPELIPIQLNDSDERFIMLSKELKENIMVGHQITSPMLFGIKTEGQLGGRAEMLDALAIMQSTYVSQRQKTIEDSINQVLGTDYKLKQYTLDNTAL